MNTFKQEQYLLTSTHFLKILFCEEDTSIRRRLFDLLVPGSFPDQFYRVGGEVIKNKVDFYSNTRKSK